MAKAGTLAGLAALAGAAYMMSKDKDKGVTNTGDETSRMLARKPAPLKTPQESIAERMVKPDNSGENYSNEGYGKGVNQAGATGVTTLGPDYNRATVTKPARPSVKPKGMKPPSARSFKGGQTGYDEAGNFLGGRQGYDEAGNPMKKGGSVKMASGGMTASSRADGIAKKGKTRCKIC